jgi:Uma2 family endonuclease
MFAMAGASNRHSLIKDNVARETGYQLKGGPCQVVTSDQRVKVDITGLYTYPDVVIYCDDARFEDNKSDTLLNPRVLVEVLSDSTEKYDRGTKFGHYRQIPSLQEYILIAQDRPLVERYVRQADNSWLLTVFDQLEMVFPFVSIPAQIPLEEVYRGVKFGELTFP